MQNVWVSQAQDLSSQRNSVHSCKSDIEQNRMVREQIQRDLRKCLLSIYKIQSVILSVTPSNMAIH